MPPFVGRKRRSSSPASAPPPPAKRAKTAPATNAPKKAVPTPRTKSTKFSFGSDSDSSLSDVDSDELEDVPPPVNVARTHKQPQPGDKEEEEDSEDGDDDEDDFEDVPAQSTAPDFSNRDFKDINITVQGEQEPDYTTRVATKKGPSRREKQARMYTHKMHVQLLLWHNAIRNGWVNDKKVHEILLKHLPPQIINEIEKWRRASGLVKQEEQTPPVKESKKKTKKWKANGERNERDWGRPSQLLEEGKPNMSNGDPIITLLKVLAAFWKKKFAITAPGLRKRGYGTKLGLRKDIESYRNEKHHPAKHGEKIETLDHFRRAAAKCEGSRDVGAQLFTALLRAIGIQTRMVASLQPAGFGFTKAEEMLPRKIVDPESSSTSDDERDDVKRNSESASKSNRSTLASKNKVGPKRPRGGKTAPIKLDPDSEIDPSSDESVVDVTPSMPKARPAKYDKDLAFPICWAEAVSPITSKVYPVSPFLLENPVATSAELLLMFEPRGVKAEKARQVMAYVVAYSSDYSGKDVTLRYLRKRLWPGKTKGFRVPVEKVPIYDQRGKIKRYEDYDWFKHVLSIYCRSHKDRSAVDDLEDSTDLVPAEAEKKELEGDTLQSLKQSAEFVIEKHLRREEALVPGSKPVRTFSTGKGDKLEDHPIYKRTDVRKVMTAESWHKEGRAPKEGETPMKLAPVRAVTLARKREAEAHLIRTGEKQMQGLYAEDQTDWIIPPPIENGIIPKNAYNNIDCFVPSMVPKGAVHVPLKGTVRICKKLEIDYAEAVVGFEFGNKMAVPVILGVVIAKENEKPVRDAWRIYSEEQRKKEETKMEKLVLDLWGKFYRGLIIRARVHEEYGLDLGSGQANTGASRDEAIHLDYDARVADGGFIPDHDENEFGGGFLMDHEDDHHPGSDLEMEAPTASQQEPTVHDNEDEDIEADTSQGYSDPVSAPTVRRATGKPKPKLKSRDNINKHVVEDSADSDSARMSDAAQILGKENEMAEAGGFLMDDDGSDGRSDAMDIDKPIVNDDPSNTSTDLNSSSKGNKRLRSLTGPSSRGRGRPRKSTQPATKNPSGTRTVTQAKTTPVSTRKTPSRSAKTKTLNLNADGAASEPSDFSSSSTSESQVQSDSELSEITLSRPKPKTVEATVKAQDTSTPHAEIAKAKPTKSSPTNWQRGRGRPRKSRSTKNEAASPTKEKKLLRKENTIVTSPYFEQD